MTLVACTWSLSAQTRTYHGTVLDAANNEPLIGATIMPIGGGTGAAADLDGNFTLTVPANVKKATVSYVGYTSQTVELKPDMKIFLSSTSQNLDDLVVVAYGTANKESLTGSVAVVGAKEIEDRPVTSVTAALEGNAPGVQVNNSVGSPGSEPSIVIRGFNTINGTTAPLYVVDGVPYEGAIIDLNPADIESMSVLKDAASSALYGNRGANGVILITTKKAKKVGKVDVTLQIRQGMYNRGLPFYDRLEPNDWMQATFNAQVNGLVSGGNFDREGALAYVRENYITLYAGNNIYGVPDNQLFDEKGTFAPWTVNEDGTTSRVYNYLPGYTDLDWWDAMSQNGYRQEYNINAAAATEKYNVFASVGYLKENGYMLMSDFERFNGRINANFQPVDYFKFGVNLAATAQESQSATGSISVDAAKNPFNTQFTAPVYPYYRHDAEGNIVMENGEPVWNTATYLQGMNQAWVLRLDDSRNSATVIDGSIYGTAVIPYGFELTVRGNIHRDKTHGLSYANATTGDAQGLGRLGENFYNIKSHTFMQTLTWDHQYGDHHVDVLLDHENYQYSEDGSSVVVTGQVLPGMIALGNFNGVNPPSQGKGMLRMESYLGRARYNYDQKYFGEFSVRRDGTSRFHKDNRWGTFWSVGGSWVITKEKFMQGISWIDYLKLRAAYGSVGNDASAGSYSYYSLYAFAPYDDVRGLIPVQLASDNIKWEATKTFDIGLEGSLFNNRLNFTVGYFNKRNTDLLFNVVKPASGGTISNTGSNPSVLANVGTMQNIGWELQFGVDIIRTRDINWNFSIDATFMKNKIIKLPDGQDLPGQKLFQGKTIFDMYTYKWAGVDMLNGRSVYEINPNSDDFLYYDEAGAPQYSEEEFKARVDGAREDGVLIEKDGRYYTYKTQYATREHCGTSLPTVYGSFGTNFSWKGLNLSLLFTYGLGGKTSDSNYQRLMSIGTTAGAVHKDALKAWREAPAGMTAESADRFNTEAIPALDTELSLDSDALSSRFLTSSNYLVFKNLNVSYDLPMKWVSALKLQNINIGVSIDNVFIASRRKGMNPQQSFGGGQSAAYVPARVFSFQLGARF